MSLCTFVGHSSISVYIRPSVTFDGFDLILGLDDFSPNRIVKTDSAQSPPYDLIVPEFVTDYYTIPRSVPQQNVSVGLIEFGNFYYDKQDLQLYAESVDIPYRPLNPEHIIGINDPINKTYIQRTDIEFMKLSMRCITVLVSFGDNGAYGYGDDGNLADCSNKLFHPSYPATCPYITSVDATELINTEYKRLQNTTPACTSDPPPVQCISNGMEAAVDYGTWSYTTVKHYFDSMNDHSKNNFQHLYPISSMYNQFNRGFAHIAAFGVSAHVILNGIYNRVGRTSISAPLWGGIVSVLNSYSLSITNRTLGFLNPLLYRMGEEMPECCNDITIGDNKCTQSVCTNQCQGFQTARG
ncbi:unnamed protein product [Didymodactylos carnosus]|uniref:Peptidase S53 domain-containing protein n=1 Tax=Didymodactylos carnosus TaxID=1234261 RepID=A0A815Y060_9BILA|nr:unnamed protein product [Didymodactylos carnosus]CAF1563986.1 unnamed protein product [Didymodactylos carnosus]CAF4276960.1 unnamed protein product [Didymodactylos carnosus]CAF4425942.1 unnamed protein product [Didymodactylos carnosus]